MLRIHSISAAAILALVTTLAQAATAQDAPPPGGPCRDAPCRIQVDWGPSASAASYGADRRYGAAADIEMLIKQHLAEHKFRIVETGADAMLLTLRIKMVRAMCDQMAGTSTDMSCQTIDEIMVQFTTPDPTVKAPGMMRVTNRCGAGDTKMTIAQIAKYSADYLAYNLATDKKGLKRAVSRC